jgi:hypothetical protein
MLHRERKRMIINRFKNNFCSLGYSKTRKAQKSFLISGIKEKRMINPPETSKTILNECISEMALRQLR